MKFNDVSFPHPVLGVGESLQGKFGFGSIPNISSTPDFYEVAINCEHDNDELIELINSGDAEYLCEATCSSTLYREVFKSSSNEFKIVIPKKQVKGSVYFTCVLVSRNYIPNYRNSKFHSDYNGFSFEIDAGDLLIYFGEFNFNADIIY